MKERNKGVASGLPPWRRAGVRTGIIALFITPRGASSTLSLLTHKTATLCVSLSIIIELIVGCPSRDLSTRLCFGRFHSNWLMLISPPLPNIMTPSKYNVTAHERQLYLVVFNKFLLNILYDYVINFLLEYACWFHT